MNKTQYKKLKQDLEGNNPKEECCIHLDAVKLVKSLLASSRSQVVESLKKELKEMKKGLITKNSSGNCNPRCHDSGQETAITNFLFLLDKLK